MSKGVKLLLVFFDETDRWEELPLYEALVLMLKQAGISGATVYNGIMGFGINMMIHRKRLFGVSDNRPITIAVVETEENLQKVIPTIQEMVKEGVIIMLDAQQFPLTAQTA